MSCVVTRAWRGFCPNNTSDNVLRLVNKCSPLVKHVYGAMPMGHVRGGRAARARARLWRMHLLQYVVYYLKYRYGPVGCRVPEWGS